MFCPSHAPFRLRTTRVFAILEHVYDSIYLILVQIYENGAEITDSPRDHPLRFYRVQNVEGLAESLSYVGPIS